MNKLTLIFLLISSYVSAYSQHDFFVFKKKNKVVATFYQDSYIAFQLKNQDWQTGTITRIRNDSFWVRPMVVHYNLMNTDTLYFDILPFSFSDVYAMPMKGLKIDYVNGRYQVIRSAGHVHWYWIKSGWIFRAGAAGYAALNVINGLINKDFKFSGSKLGIAAAVFAGGYGLKKIYKWRLILGKKYHFQTIRLPGSDSLAS